jgi:hypothetical protein
MIIKEKWRDDIVTSKLLEEHLLHQLLQLLLVVMLWQGRRGMRVSILKENIINGFICRVFTNFFAEVDTERRTIDKTFLVGLSHNGEHLV